MTTIKKCLAGIEFPNGSDCPKCKAKLGEVCWPGINKDLIDVAKLREAAKIIIEGYPRADVSHEEFRVTAYKVILDALGEESPLLKVFSTGTRDK